ncbi:unnamed protein product [Cyclocybe aegerita]|uniref:Uncharacterized protein n=1 Tax=Cyclocybe aegerita TaxID=1973307 RepID=A0A8S0VZW8_CYCAE|nr:unnamed protein product [Cyclocybe aegerita]
MHLPSSKDLRFPQELIESFIDHLAAASTIEDGSTTSDVDTESHKALLQCLLVARSFHHRARHHLFSEVIVVNRTKLSRRFSTFRDLLHDVSPSIPSLASTITSIRLIQSYSDLSEEPLDSGAMTAIMRRLHGPDYGVRKFSLELYGTQWIDLPTDFQDALQALCHSPHLKNLQLKQLYDPPMLLFTNTFLENLSLRECRSRLNWESALTGDDELVPSDEDAFPRLRSFDTDFTYLFPKRDYALNTSNPAMSPHLFSQLQHLSTVFESHERSSFQLIEGFLSVASNSIQTLEMHVWCGLFVNPVHDPIMLISKPMRHLSTVNLLFNEIRTPGVPPISNQLTTVAFILAALPSSMPSLRSITVELNFQIGREQSWNVVVDPTGLWTTLERRLFDVKFCSVSVINVLIRPVMIPGEVALEQRPEFERKVSTMDSLLLFALKSSLLRSLSSDRRFALNVKTGIEYSQS